MKFWRKNITRFGASLFVLGLCTALVFSDWTPTNAQNLPAHVPAKKPDLNNIQKAALDDNLEENSLAFGFMPFSGDLDQFEEDQPTQTPAKELSEEKMAEGKTYLTSGDIDRYIEIFALQNEGKMNEAQVLIDKLEDKRLLGHVLYQRYMHPTAYTSSFDELQGWMKNYADLPGAQDIYELAQKKRAEGSANMALKAPISKRGIVARQDPTIYQGKSYISANKRTSAQRQEVDRIQSKVMAMVRRNGMTEATRYLNSAAVQGLLDETESDILQAQISAGFLYIGRLDKAYVLASSAANNSGIKAPLAGWVAGLISWKRGNYNKAAHYFEMTASSPYASGWTNAAGSYWAARAHMRLHNVREVSQWLQKAAAYPRSFYGLIATRALGQDFEFNWDVPTFTKEYFDVLSAKPAGRRAMALVAIGQNDLAEAELLRMSPAEKEMRQALIAYANYAGLPAVAIRLGSTLSALDNEHFDAALYPTGSWLEEGTYAVDPALVHAIMRQESRFDPRAKSGSGARGLMQLMPSTAKYVVQKENLDSEAKGDYLNDPQTNLLIGQTYINTLLQHPAVEGNILSMLIAYNAGPGNLRRWQRKWDDVTDPLLFVELIPAGEARAYVERVASNYWMYRLREGLPTPTLDAIAQGRAAHYASIETAAGN